MAAMTQLRKPVFARLLVRSSLLPHRHRARPCRLVGAHNRTSLRVRSSVAGATRKPTPLPTSNHAAATATSPCTPRPRHRAVGTSSSPTKPGRNILPLHIVQAPAVKSALPIIGNVSYLALASGFLMTDMLVLRLALVGGYAGLVAFHALHSRPLRIPLRWSALFVAVNAGAACILLADRYAGHLSDDDEDLYVQHFPMLSRGQFLQLLELGRTEAMPDGTALTVEGVPCDKLYFIRGGMAKLYLRDAFAANCDEGSFVNDVAFNQGEGEGAYGTVVVHGGTASVLVWDKATLRTHLQSRPEMDKNLKYCLTTHLVRGLLQQREVAHMTIGQWSTDKLSRKDDDASYRTIQRLKSER